MLLSNLCAFLNINTQDRKELFDLGHVPHRSLPHDHELNRVLDGYNQVRWLLQALTGNVWLEKLYIFSFLKKSDGKKRRLVFFKCRFELA